MLNITGKRIWYFLLSAIIIVPGLISIGLFGFKEGLEFSSGTAMTLVFSRPVDQAELRQELTRLGHNEAIIQRTQKPAFTVTPKSMTPEVRQAVKDAVTKDFGASSVFFASDEQNAGPSLDIVFAHMAKDTQDQLVQTLKKAGQGDAQVKAVDKEAFLVRTRTVGQEPTKDAQGNVTQPSELEQLDKALTVKFGPVDTFDFYSVSPVMASEVVRNAAIATVIACVGILIYMAWAFRKMPKPLRWGVCAIAGLANAILIMLGVFSILGKTMGIEVDALFITAILTVIGYGVNDIVVVFDRIRENVKKGISRDFEFTINQSLVETLGRSLITGMGAIFVMLALFLIGGVTLRNFILALLIGVIGTTYSSIFISSQLLLVWETKNWGSLSGRPSSAKGVAKG